MKRSLLLGVFGGLFLSISNIQAQAYTENFDDVATLTGSGWFQQNNSTTIGVNPNWIQGVPVPTGPFDAFNGATNAYICANFNSTTGNNTISNWLVTPNRTFRNGDVFTFYTRRPTPAPTEYPDRLEVRLSTNGASTNVGVGPTATGDFTTLLLSINPSLVTGVYPAVWTQFTITISGLPAPTSGRIAFRYFVTNAGPTGSNSDFIGIDNVVYTPYVCPTFTMTPGGALTGGAAGTAYNTTLTQTGALGAPSFAVTAGALPPGLTLSAGGTISGTPTATGTFNFTVTVSDNSGCSGSSSYSITVVCPANPITLSAFPALCNNASPITLTQGSPAGGTYSGTGVSAGQFDPSAGSQTITYDYTDPYGCSHASNGSITVNTAPVVTLGAYSDVCDNAGLVDLTGGQSPVGGTFSGTGVTGNDFDPTSGTQTITYTYTDGNGCTNSDSEIQTVNVAPTVTLGSYSTVCSNAGLVDLTGGQSPVGGTFSGTSVTGNDFDPSNGTQTITYTYTDANGCSNSASEVLIVNTAPNVSLSSFAAVCSNEGMVALSGGSPAGGSFSGTGVTGTDFDPASGTQTITYTFTDSNSCVSSDSEVLTVNAAPSVNLTVTNSTLCLSHASEALTGTPSGGTYFGSSALTGNMFNPAAAGVGTYNLSYTFTDGNGCADTASASIQVSGCAGIEDESSSMDVNLYPNPAEDFIQLDINSELNNSDYKLEIVSIDGKIYFSKNSVITGNHIETIQVSNLAAGTYFVKLQNNNGNVITRKFIKK